MRFPSPFSLAFVSLLAVASANVAKSEGRSKDAPIPAQMRAFWGTWDVERVTVDLQERAHWTFEPNDPRLMGRTLLIDELGVSFNGLSEPCPQTHWTSHTNSWSTVLSTGFHRTDAGKHAPQPRPLDFDLNVEGNATLAVVPICEGLVKGQRGQSYLSGKWVALMGSDQLVFGYDGAALLLLKRRASDAKTIASFPCTSAHSPTENAICQTFELAAWDRSVAAAWRGAYKKTATPAALLEGQQLWLQKRDTCGARIPCIAEQLRTRVSQLLPAL